MEQHAGWSGDNVLVQDARRPFVRGIGRLLQVGGLPAVAGLPSERRISAGIDTLGFYSYPLLFYPAFPAVSLAQLRELSRCGSYLFDYVLCLDELLDCASSDRSGAVLLGGALQREALSGLSALFPPDSEFWPHFDRYYAQFCRAVLAEEAQHRQLVRPYSERELTMICAGKAAMAKGCLAALATLGGDDGPLARLEASHDAFYVGFQLADDLADWRVDYQRRHYTSLLTHAFLAAGWQRRVESDQPPDSAEVADLLRRTGAAAEVRRLALGYLDRAERELDGVVGGTWLAAIHRTRSRVAGLDPVTGDPVPGGPVSGSPVSGGPVSGDRLPGDSPPGDLMSAGGSEVGSEAAAVAGLGGSANGWPLVWASAPAVAVPISAAWRAWLDPGREPRIWHAGIIEEQRRALRSFGGAGTVGAAVCQVGLAVQASLRAFPGQGVHAHLGLSAGEYEWCRQHAGWLDAAMVPALADSPRLWRSADQTPSDQDGWVPPAAVRYLGHQLVADGAGAAAPSSAGSIVDTALSRFRRRMAG